MSRYRKYYTGRYALVDKTNRNIWLNIDDEQLAHCVAQVFASKVGLLVVDLSIFKNFSENPLAIDSEVCLNWQIPPALSIDHTFLSIYDHPTVATINRYHATTLINQPLRSLLSPAQQQDFQEQIMFYVQLKQSQFLHPKFNAKINFESQQICLIKQIDHVFATELDVDSIEQTLIFWAQENLNNDNFLNLYLLNFFGRLYA